MPSTSNFPQTSDIITRSKTTTPNKIPTTTVWEPHGTYDHHQPMTSMLGGSHHNQPIPKPISLDHHFQPLTVDNFNGGAFSSHPHANHNSHHTSSSLALEDPSSLHGVLGSTFSSNSSSSANTSSSTGSSGSEDGASAHPITHSTTSPSSPPNISNYFLLNIHPSKSYNNFPSPIETTHHDQLNESSTTNVQPKTNNTRVTSMTTQSSNTNGNTNRSNTHPKSSKRKHVSSSVKNMNTSQQQQTTTTTLTFKPYPAATSHSISPHYNPSRPNEQQSSRQLLFIEENGQTKSSNSLTSGTDSNHFEISCVSCRIKHRKCDRKLPTCSYCALRGIECVYRKPRKKGRQHGKSNLQEDYEDPTLDDDQKTSEDQKNDRIEEDLNVTSSALITQQQALPSFLVRQPSSTSDSTIRHDSTISLDHFGLFNQAQTQLQNSQLWLLLNQQPPQPLQQQQQPTSIPSFNVSLSEYPTNQWNANPLHHPENLLFQIRSSLQNNDETNNVHTLHSFLTSDSISSLFQLSNMVEHDPNTIEHDPNMNTVSTAITLNSSNLVSIDDITEQLMKRLTLEDYCKSTSFPLIDEKSVSSLLQNEKKQAEASALLYSIHSLMCQRKGLKSEAESAHQKAKSILSTVFNTYENFLVACSYCNLSMYCSGEGNLDEARFFLQFVDYYLDQAEQNTTVDHIVHVNTYHLKMLKHVAEMACGMAVKETESLDSSASSMKTLATTTTTITTTTEEHSDKADIGNLLIGFYKMCSGAKQAPKPLLSIVSKTITTDTVKLYLTLLELVSKLFYQHETNRNLKDEQGQMSNRVWLALNHGTRLLILQECGITTGPMVEESANAVIDVACEDKFGVAYPIMLSAVAASCRVHLKVIKEIEQGKRQNLSGDGVDYYEMIKKGLKVLTIFSIRFGRVNKLYSQLILELQEVERNYIKAKLCLLVNSEIERLKLLKAQSCAMTSQSSQSVLSFLSKEDILSIYYLVPPPSIQDSQHK